jgi:hypothetical protein
VGHAYGQTLPAPAGRRPATAPLIGLAAAALVLALGVGRFAWPVTLRDGPTRPISAVAAVPAQVAATPVFNDYAFGGYLIARHIAPYIDSRADFYGDAFLKAYMRLLEPDGAALAQVLDRRHIGWTILVPGSPVARAMDEMPGWRRLSTDRWAVVHVRVAPAPSRPCAFPPGTAEPSAPGTAAPTAGPRTARRGTGSPVPSAW